MHKRHLCVFSFSLMEKKLSAYTKYQIVDILNSLSWLLMDASWLYRFSGLSGVSMVILLTTGSLICVQSKSISETLSHTALYLWMWMNSLWMLSDLYGYKPLEYYAKLLFPLSIISLLISFLLSSSWPAISKNFSRFRGFIFFRKHKS